MGVDEHSPPPPTTGQLLADAIVGVVDRRRFVTLAQLHAELAASSVDRGDVRIVTGDLLGDDPIGALRDAVAERDDLFALDDLVFSSASLVAGRRYTARLERGLDLADVDDLVPLAGIQRRLPEPPAGLPVVAGDRRMFVVESIPAALDGSGRYLVAGAPDGLETDRFGTVQPGELHVEVIGGDRLASGEAEVAALRSALIQLQPTGRGCTARSLVAYAIFLNDRCFRAPTLPVTDLLGAAGLEERAGEWGPADRPWTTGAEAAIDRHVHHVAADHGLDEAQLERFRWVMERWRSWIGGRPGIDTAEFAAALRAGRVAAAFAEAWQPRSVTSLDAWMDQRRLVETIARAAPDDPSVNYLRGMIDLRLGDGGSALANFERALRVDPDFGPARDEVGVLVLDRGELDRALTLLEPGHLTGDAVRALLERAGNDRRQADRGAPCRCGSGRKYRSCCARHLELREDERAALRTVRLHAFLATPPWSMHMERLADIVSTEWGVMSFPEALAEPFVQDVLLVEGGGAAAYLSARRSLLGEQEIAALAQYTARHRAVYDVAANDGERVELVDPDSGRRTSLPDAELAGALVGRDAVLARTIEHRDRLVPAGPSLRIPAAHVALLRVVLASRPTAEQLLGWVCRRAEILRPPIDLTGDIDLRDEPIADLLDGFDLDDLARRAMES